MSGSGNKPRAWRAMKRILEAISEKGSITQDDAQAFFSNVRMYIEFTKVDNFDNLKAICNVMLHDSLDRKNSLFPLKYLINVVENGPRDESLGGFGLNAINWGSMFEELEKLIILADLPTDILYNVDLNRELFVSALPLVARKYFSSAALGVYNADGSTNWKIVEKFGLKISSGFVYSFETSHFISSSGLDCYGLCYTIDRGLNSEPMLIVGLIAVGRCSKCNSPHIKGWNYTPGLSQGQNVAQCASCGFIHPIDNEVFTSAADPFYGVG